MNIALPTPSAERVRAACEEFDKEYRTVENAISELFNQYRGNGDLSHVLLKVVTLNALYSTRIPVYSTELPDVEDVARHIQQSAQSIDAALAAESPGIVDSIARVTVPGKKDRLYFSFAAKYCSWHKPTAYPIYDANVEACLWHYSNQDGFAKFRREGYGYPEFVRRMTSFRDFPAYGLRSFTFKDLDKFLWYQGETLRLKDDPKVD